MREINHYYNFRMNKEKEEYFRDLEEVLQSLKKQIQIEEERNAKVNRSKLINIRLNRMILIILF